MKRAKKKTKVKVDSIEKLAVLMQDGFSELRDEIGQRFDIVEAELRRIRMELADIHRRLDRLEEQGARQAGYSKEIDYLLGRVSRNEKHLKLV